MPAKVDKLFEEVKEKNPSYSDEQAWATAWSIYCKHVNPDSKSCHLPTSEYLKGKTAMQRTSNLNKVVELAESEFDRIERAMKSLQKIKTVWKLDGYHVDGKPIEAELTIEPWGGQPHFTLMTEPPMSMPVYRGGETLSELRAMLVKTFDHKREIVWNLVEDNWPQYRLAAGSQTTGKTAGSLSFVAKSILRKVLDAMQEAEEIGGPEDDDYAVLMQTISDEARKRLELFRHMNKQAAQDKETTFYGDRGGPWTPWGPAQDVREVIRGVRWVTTAGHGGLGVARGVASKLLSGAAIKSGDYQNGYFWYEEDCASAIPFYEHPEWAAKLGFRSDKEMLLKSLERWEPGYLEMAGLGEKALMPPKAGMKLRFTEAVDFRTHAFKPGDVVEVVKVSGSSLIFQAEGRNQYGEMSRQHFKLPLGYYYGRGPRSAKSVEPV